MAQPFTTADCRILRPGNTAYECQPLRNGGGFAYLATVLEARETAVRAMVHGPNYAPPTYHADTGARCGGGTSGSRAFLSPVLPANYRLIAAKVAA